MAWRSRGWVLLVCSLLVWVVTGCDGDERDEETCFLVTELEPNDVFETPAYVTQAQEVGELRRGDCVLVSGAFGTAEDVSDGYGFLLFAAQDLALTLEHRVVADFDVLLFDTRTGIRLATCASGLEPEVCDVGPVIGSVDVVVVPAPASGGGTYTLEIVSF
jgi:hypothetical protein